MAKKVSSSLMIMKLYGGIESLIGPSPGIRVVGEAGTAKEAVEQVARHRPEVILMEFDAGASGSMPARRSPAITPKRK